MRFLNPIPVALAALLLTAAPASAFQGLECGKLTASDGAADDWFGISVAFSGMTAVVGANLDDDNGTDSGSAYVFDVTTGTELFKLTASDGAADDWFGGFVAVSGTTAVVGAWGDDDNGTDSGSAYVFDTTTGTELFKLTASDGAASDLFGYSVAVSGTTAVVGAYLDDDNGGASGSAYVFDTTTGTQLFKLTASDGAASDQFGRFVAVSGTIAVVGAHRGAGNVLDSGSAYVFDVTTGTELFKLTAWDGAALDSFGISVAVSDNIAVVGALGDDDNGTLSGSAYVFDVTTGTGLFKLTASDAAANDSFGSSVAVSGTTAVVGAYGNGSFSGSAYAFNVTTGTELTKLTASDGAAGDSFGISVALNGSTAVVGAQFDDDNGTNSGSAYVFDVTTGTAPTKLTASDGAANDSFGISVAVSGSIAVVGAHGNGLNTGSAYAFNVTTGTELFKLTASDGAAGDSFGGSVALNGSTAVVGAQFDDDNGSLSGSAYVFDTTTGTQLFKLTASDGAASDFFGTSVAVSGSTAVVGAYLDDDNGTDSGSAYVFDTTTGTELFKLTASDGAASDFFGFSVAVSGGIAVVGAFWDDDNGTNSGSAYVFDVTTGTQLTKLTASDGAPSDFFGRSVAVSGGIAVVGAFWDDDNGTDSGSAYVFDTTTGTELTKLTASDGAADDYFGFSVALSGSTAVVGAWGDDDNSDSGSAYAFDVTTGTELTKLTTPDGAAGDSFGYSVALSGSTAVVGAWGDDDNGTDSGSAYVFDTASTPGTYCTAGTSASGCQALISHSGTPSATAVSGFWLAASGVEGAKSGLFFYGTNGRQANPWGSGTSYQCVVPPVKRGGLLLGVGSAGACDGSFSQDLNARWCAACPRPLHNPGPGATVQAQLWYRDPFSTSNQTTGFSDAVEFCVGP